MTTSDGAVMGTTKVVDNGPASLRFNLVVFGDGYQAGQLPQYASDVDRFVGVLFATAPFGALRSAINVYRVDVSSTDSGADDPAACGGSGATARTYFDASFCNSGIQRLLLVDNGTVIATANAQVPEWTTLLVIVNSTVYGGAGGQVATFSLAANAEEIGLHEMGHTAFGLADEYQAFVGCGLESDHDHHPPGEPVEANVTTNTNRSTLKWRHLVAPSTPLPTTRNPDCTQCDFQASPVPAGTVGLFEGAHYYHCGAFRPEFACRMRDLGNPFCAVCQERIRTVMAAYRGQSLPTLRRGATGQAVRNLHGLLLAHGHDPRGIDGIFGPNTEAAVRASQRKPAIAVDGVVGPQTWGALLAAGQPTLRRGATGQAVRNLQGLLLAHGHDPRGIDGIFGPGTEAAVRAFQRQAAIAVDGVVGPQTWGALLG
ncbi:MAG: M64 family metallopeptidase [Acidimicrobiales bacterium]